MKARTEDITTNRLGGVKRTLHDPYKMVGTIISPEINRKSGVLIFEQDWDLMIVLDACRFDVMAEVADNLNWLPAPECKRSVGTGSREWMEGNFGEEQTTEMKKTAYITANPWSENKCKEEDFRLLEEVWRFGHDTDLDVTPPRTVTDKTIQVGREYDIERCLVHYMQPHAPFIPQIEKNKQIMAQCDGFENSIWRAVLRGRVDAEWVWEAYKQNLRLVLEDVKLLIDNFDAESTIVTADHGNAIGEWGLFGHSGPAIAPVVNIPWIKTSATDNNTHKPDFPDKEPTRNREEQLEKLGYLV